MPRLPFVPPAERAIKEPAWLNDVTNYHNRGDIPRSCDQECQEYGDFSGLDDLFTEQPDVMTGLAQIYGDWIRRYRIDGFRVDTARHVNPEFFRLWVPRVLAAAREAGVGDFEIFGEAFVRDAVALSTYVRERGLPNVLDFPLQDPVVRFAAGVAGSRGIASRFADDDYYALPNGVVHTPPHIPRQPRRRSCCAQHPRRRGTTRSTARARATRTLAALPSPRRTRCLLWRRGRHCRRRRGQGRASGSVRDPSARVANPDPRRERCHRHALVVRAREPSDLAAPADARDASRPASCAFHRRFARPWCGAHLARGQPRRSAGAARIPRALQQLASSCARAGRRGHPRRAGRRSWERRRDRRAAATAGSRPFSRLCARCCFARPRAFPKLLPPGRARPRVQTA